MDFKYKPRAIKPSISTLYAPAPLTQWSLGGDKRIDTQFEAQVALYSSTTKDMPKGSWVDAYSIPNLAKYGAVKINPGGVILKYNTNTKKIESTLNLERAKITAQSAINNLVAQQYTNLDIQYMVPTLDPSFPVILLYQLALIHSTARFVAPALHFNSFLDYLESFNNFTITSAHRIDLIKKQLNRARFVAPRKAYMEYIQLQPLHQPTVYMMKEFLTLEKLNNAENTSVDFACIDLDVIDASKVYSVSFKANSANTQQNILVKADKVNALKERNYLVELLTLMTMTDDDFSKAMGDNGILWTNILSPFVEAFQEQSANLVGYPTIVAPYYTALAKISDIIDPTVFRRYTENELTMGIRRSSYYASGNIFRLITYTYDNNPQYPTIDCTVPLYNGSILPADQFDSNGIFLIKTPEIFISNNYYNPFIDISDMILKEVYFATHTDLSTYFDVQTVRNGFIPLVKFNKFTTDTPTLSFRFKADPDFSKAEYIMNDVFMPFVNYLALKHGFVSGENSDGTNRSYAWKSPLWTGSRPVSLPNNLDIIYSTTNKVLGFNPIIPVIK